MIGSGIIVQGYVFAESGIIAAIFEYIIISFMIYTGIEMIVRCAQHKSIFDYAELAQAVFPPEFHGAAIIDACMVITNAGALLSYILVIGSLMVDIVGTFSSCTGDDDSGRHGSWFCNIGFLTVLPIVFFTVPLCLIRKFGHLAIISYFSITVIAAVMFLVIIGGPIRHQDFPDDDSNENHQIKLGSFVGSIKTIGDIVFALGYVTAAFHSYNAMEVKTVKNFSNVALYTTIIGAIMCFFMGLAGYLSFGANTQTNILMNFPGVIGAVFKVLLVVHLILYIPGDFVILRAALWRLFGTDVEKQSNTSFLLVTLATILTITFIAIMLQLYSNANNLGVVVDITGGVAGSVLYFIAPGLAAMRLFPDDKLVYYRSMGIAVFGFAIVVLVIAGSAL
jgi:amino acid permease